MFDRISISQANGSEPIILAGNDASDSVQDFQPTGQPNIQRIMPLRATEPIWVDRGGKVTSFSFTACRKHDTIPQATMFVFDHMEEINYVGKISLECEYDGLRIAREGNGCIKQVGMPKRIGLTTYIRYEMEIGTVTIPT